MNFQDVIRSVYDKDQNLLRTSAGSSSSTVYIGTPTLYAVVNTGGSAANVTLNPSPNFIGIVTVANSQTNTGNVTLNGGPNQIGSVTVSNPITVGNAMVTVTLGTKLDSTNDSVDIKSGATVTPASAWTDPKTFIGLVTAVGTFGNTGNTTLNPSPNFIGIVTVANPGATSGNVTLDPGSKTGIVGNLTLSDSKGYIGLVTANIVGSVNTGMLTIFPGPNQIGSVTVSNPITIGNAMVTVTLGTKLDSTNDSVDIKSGATVTPASAWTDPTTYIGLVTATLSGSVNTGMTTLFPGPNQIGSVTVSNQVPVNVVGNLTLSDPKGFIGLVTMGGGTAWKDPNTYIGLVTATMAGSVNTGMTTLFPGPNQIGSVTVSNPITLNSVVTLSPSVNSIGFTTVAGIVTANLGTGNVTLNASNANIGSVSVLGGGIGINAGINNIGFTTVYNATAWPDPKTYVGLVTIGHTANVAVIGNLTLSNSNAYIGLTTSTLGIGTQKIGLVTLSASNANIGSVSVLGGTIAVSGLSGNVTLSDAKTYVGLTTSTLGVGTTFIGLVTAWTRNAGTAKTLISLPVGLGQNSLATVAVPTNANKINVTNFVLSSNITTVVAIKSGVTYLTGNASLGITLFPGGGFELPGSPDSPSWIGLPSGALVVEKRDPGGTTSAIGGGLIYFDE